MFGFYEYHARSGVDVAEGLVAWRRIGRGSYKPFLHHVTKGRPVPTRPIKLRVPTKAPRTLSAEQVVAVLAAPQRARDRFLLALLAETGMRIGQALGLRHADFVSRAKEVRIVPRADNVNGARAKLRSPVTVPVTAGLVRCYSDYMYSEYCDVDSDYVFVNLWAGRIGAPMTYAAVHELVGRIRNVVGFDFTVHMLRHTHATELIRSGVAIEVVARLLTHQSSTTTSQTYVHLDVADVRAALQRAGVWDKPEAAFVTSSGAARHLRVRPGVVSGGGDIVEAEYAKDIWDAVTLGIAVRRGRNIARFGVIHQVWLREAIKRWSRFRLGVGYSFSTIDAGAQALARWSLFLDERPDVADAADITRPLLESFLSWMASSRWGVNTRSGTLTFVKVFLDWGHRHGTLPGLPANAVIYEEEVSRPPDNLPQFIPEFVMAQLESDTNLARLPPDGPPSSDRAHGDRD